MQGPRARDVLAPFVDGIDLSPDGYAAHDHPPRPYLRRPDAACSASASPASSASRSTCPPATPGAVWEALCAPASPRHSPYGTETMHVLRAEKGYIIVGQETDGTVTPDDLGLAG